MGQGTLIINTMISDGALPVGNVNFMLLDKQGNTLFSGQTDEHGMSPVLALSAPDRKLSYNPDMDILPYSTYDLWLAKPEYATTSLLNIEIFDGQQAILPVDMTPVIAGYEDILVEHLPPPLAEQQTENTGEPGPEQLQQEGFVGTDIGDSIGDYAQRQGSGTLVQNIAGPGHTTQDATGLNPIVKTNTLRQHRRLFGNLLDRLNHHNDEQLTYIQSTPDDLERILPTVVIPEYVVVHLGTPSNTSAQNVRVRFVDYIKNVTCSEIFPTWPRDAIIANIHCIVTFTLNRMYTQWYRVRGYDFDITNNTGYDQFYVHNREIFANISQLVDETFDVYAKRQGFNNPFFTEYCNGTTSTCNGLSQWGTVPLAEKGMTPLQILHYYYPDDLELTTAPSGVIDGFPGTMRQGESGDVVARIQVYLNRIAANYPLIPKINPVDGSFGAQTVDAVKAFQKTFNLTQDGIIGRSTWNRINQIYSAVTKLSELQGEGERIGLSPNPPTTTIRQGNRGADTMHLQFLLNYIGEFFDEIIPPVQDSIFGDSTTDAVKAFQRHFGLTADGVVGAKTWRALYETYRELQGDIAPPPQNNKPSTPPPTQNNPFPGYILRQGQSGANIRTLQNLLNHARTVFGAIPAITVDGVFGPATTQAVRTFQLYSGLVNDGLVGPQTWAALASI
ncbi:MAG: peptidoglycan-binding protein [Firmicutes bacterium]|nr:peptidoglycan-binding protein [Bacillota bacterium]MCL1954018.1 peptidoglycan-binding protein [Bacillota bacterium]